MTISLFAKPPPPSTTANSEIAVIKNHLSLKFQNPFAIKKKSENEKIN
jgi:hypothetical protein